MTSTYCALLKEHCPKIVALIDLCDITRQKTAKEIFEEIERRFRIHKGVIPDDWVEIQAIHKSWEETKAKFIK